MIPYQCAIDGPTDILMPHISTLLDLINAKSFTPKMAFRAYSDKNVVGAPVSTKKWIDSDLYFPSGPTGKDIIGRPWGPKMMPYAVVDAFL